MMPNELDAIDCGDTLADPPPWTYDESELESREGVYVSAGGKHLALFFLRQGDRRKQDVQNLYFLCNARLNVRELSASLRNAWARIEELESERQFPVAITQATVLCQAIEAANRAQGSTECVDGLFCWSGQRARAVLKAYETLRMTLCSSCSSD